MLINAWDWFLFTYPSPEGWEGSEAARAKEVERVCLRRLEAIHWPDGPKCPKCGTCHSAAPAPWADAPRGWGWRCRRCKARFHILQALPPMAGTHHPSSIWFRAIYLLDKIPNLSSVALGKELDLDQGVAWKLGRAVRQMRADDPTLVRRLVNGPNADHPARRKARKPASTTARNPAIDNAERSEVPDEAGPHMRLPSALDEAC